MEEDWLEVHMGVFDWYTLSDEQTYPVCVVYRIGTTWNHPNKMAYEFITNSKSLGNWHQVWSANLKYHEIV